MIINTNILFCMCILLVHSKHNLVYVVSAFLNIAIYFLSFGTSYISLKSLSPESNPTVYVMHCMWYTRVEDLSLSVVEWFKIISDFFLAFQEIYHHLLSVSDVMTMFRLRDMVRPIQCVCVLLFKERTVTLFCSVLFCSLKLRARQPCAQLMDQCVFYVL
jgi:hypothetical protein